jgi:hypothetical protein
VAQGATPRRRPAAAAPQGVARGCAAVPRALLRLLRLLLLLLVAAPAAGCRGAAAAAEEQRLAR